MTEKQKLQQDPPQRNDLITVGQVLRKKREEHSYTLEHVSEITRISLTSLRNIEEGKREPQTGLVFIRGFVRNYAKLLGIESDWMVVAFDEAYNITKNTYPAEKSENASGTNQSLIILGAATGLVLVAIGLLYWNLNPSSQIAATTETIEPVQDSVTQKESTTANTVQDTISTLEQDSGEAKSQLDSLNAVISPLNLVLVGKKDAWIRLTVDNQKAIEQRLREGEKYEWPADDEYRLMMTTGGTASIHLNGEEIDIPAELHNQLYSIKLNKFSLTQLNN